MTTKDEPTVLRLSTLVLLWPLLGITELGLETIPLRIACCYYLVFPRSLETSRHWGYLILSYGLFLGCNLTTADNHKWLFFYFVLSLGVAYRLSEKRQTPVLTSLRESSAALLIASFSLALGWKFSNPQFLNGDFFEFTLAGGDTRLQDFAVLVLGYLPAEIKRNVYQLNNPLNLPEAAGYTTPLLIKPALRLMAKFFTAYGVIVEALIVGLYALSFRRPRFKHYASLTLLLFIGSVYFITPVFAFGQLLALLGFASTENPRHQRLFIAAYFLMVALNSPWSFYLNS